MPVPRSPEPADRRKRRRVGRVPVAILALALPLSAGLSGCDEPRPAYTVRDSAGVRIVENRAPEWGPEEVWRLGEPSLDLGGANAAGAEAFEYVAAAFFSGDGRLVVVETGGDIHTFAPDGRHLDTAGGDGDGPGEFRMVAGAGILGDTIWVYDYSHRRLTYLDLRGDLRAVHPLEGEDPSLMPVGRLGDGFLLGATYRPGAAAEARRLGLRRDTVRYRRFGPQGERGPVLGRGAAREYAVLEEDGRLTMATPPFARRAHDATGAGLWVHGDQARRSIRVHEADGTLRTILRWPGESLEITESAVRQEVERRIRHYNEDEAGLRRFFSELPHPDRRPAHGRIHVGPDGRIWVETAPGPGHDGPYEAPGWLVFTSDGRWLGTIAAPARFRITQLQSDRVVGVWQDALDVEHVQVRPLLHPEG